MEKYKPKNEVLQEFLQNDEAQSAHVTSETVLISAQDVDTILERALKPLQIKGLQLADAAHDYKDFHSIGNGAKLSVAIKEFRDELKGGE